VLEEGGWSMPCPGHFIPERDPAPTTQEAGWAPGLVWTGAENIAPHGFDPQTVEPTTSYATLAH